MAEVEKITVRLVRSMIGRPEKQRLVLRGMGLTKLQKSGATPRYTTSTRHDRQSETSGAC